MKKKLFIFIFLAIFMILGSKAFVGLFSYQMMEKLKQENQSDIALTYSWISSSFDGVLSLHDVVITPYALKRTIYLDKVDLYYANYLDLVLSLQNLRDGDISGLQKIWVADARMPLKGRDIDEWLAMEYSEAWFKPLGLYACGEKTRTSHDSLRDMGINEIKASLQLEKTALPASQEENLSLILDLFQLGKLEISSSWSAGSAAKFVSSLSMEKPQIKSLSLTHQENGYFRRLSNYCSEMSKLTREEYSRLAAQMWRLAMYDIGLVTDQVTENLYHDYLLQGGKLEFAFDFPSAEGGENWPTLKSILDLNLAERFGLIASLNERKIDKMRLILDGKRIMPPKVIAKAPEKEKLDTNKDLSEYHITEYDQLEAYLGQQSKVQMKDGNSLNGLIKSVTKKHLTISQLVGAGSVEYELKSSQIETISVWRLGRPLIDAAPVLQKGELNIDKKLLEDK